jgi:hypothetical protein
MGADKHIKNSPILPTNKDFLQLSIGEQSTENLCTGKKVLRILQLLQFKAI